MLHYPLLRSLIALFLLTTPTDLPIPVEVLLKLRSPLLQVAHTLEICDEREDQYYFTTWTTTSDLQILRNRYKALKNSPPIGDSLRFPSIEICTENLAFNREYRKNLVSQLEVCALYKKPLLEAAIEETDRLYKVWDLVADTQRKFYLLPVRRQALHRLRETLGGEAYYASSLPFHVPLQYFRER